MNLLRKHYFQEVAISLCYVSTLTIQIIDSIGSLSMMWNLRATGLRL